LEAPVGNTKGTKVIASLSTYVASAIRSFAAK